MDTMESTMAFDDSMVRLKKTVYKSRIRVKEFMTDFDRLRSGFVHSNHFLSALSMAGVDKQLSAAEIKTICDAYTVPKSPSLVMIDYRKFLYDVDIIFTIPELEKTPLIEVPREPLELLDKTRYMKSSRVLDSDREEAIQAIIAKLSDVVAKRGTPVKPFFDDAANDDHSAKLFGHVTRIQFKQCMNTKLELPITEEGSKLLCDKFANEDKLDLINYIAFSNTIDPIEKYLDM
jgi:hypothetical protein